MSSIDCEDWSSGYTHVARSVLNVGKLEDFGPFKALLTEGELLFGTDKNFALEIGINPTRYSKLAKGGAYTLNVRNCLKLAQILRRSPTEVLRAAGKGDIADFLDELYGKAVYEPLPGGVQGRELATEWARLTREQREAVLQVIRQFPLLVEAPPEQAKDASTKKSSRTAGRG